MSFDFSSVIEITQDTFGETVTYRQAHLPSVQVRAVYRNPVAETFVLPAGALTEATVFEIAVAELAYTPDAGDIIERENGERFKVRSRPARNETNTLWVLDATPDGART